MVSLSVRMLGGSVVPTYDSAKSTASKTKEAAQTAANTQAQTESSAAQEEFLAYARMNPVERIRADYLKSHNLTEEKLAAMTPEEQKKIEDEIRREIEQKMRRAVEEKGSLINIVV